MMIERPDRRLHTLDDVQLQLGASQRIIVTGPQRSGTTFAGQALAATLGLPYIDELQIRVGDPRLLVQLLQQGGRWVLQAPGLSYLLHDLPADPWLAVVWMLRDGDEIAASMKRVGWRQRGEAGLERLKYRDVPPCHVPSIHGFKLWHWRSWQAIRCRVPWYELHYRSPYLQDHPLHVNDADRRGWHTKQVQPEESS